MTITPTVEALTREERVAWFIVNACPAHHIRGGPGHVRALHTAGRILARQPELAQPVQRVPQGRAAVVRAEHVDPCAAREQELQHCRRIVVRGRVQRGLVAQHDDVPLMYLAGDEATCLEIARLLLASGADPLVRQPRHGWNAIELAERRCMPRVAEVLRQGHGASER